MKGVWSRVTSRQALLKSTELKFHDIQMKKNLQNKQRIVKYHEKETQKQETGQTYV